MPQSPLNRSPSEAAGFAATRWTLVLSAARGEDSPHAADALAELCCTYWYPLYAYVRRRGHPSHEAEDLTQEFFLRLLEKNYLADADRRKGKFRAFLLASFKHFLANQWDRSRAKKRGGDRKLFSLDAAGAETRYRLEPSHDMTPERLFERQWAITALAQVLARLEAEFLAEDKKTTFDLLKPFLTAGRESGGYAAAAERLRTTEGAVKTAVHRLRRRYRQLLKDEIAQTVAAPEEIDDEIRFLLECL
jgi:RNA polymerase sigma factor (sigma-70 family)